MARTKQPEVSARSAGVSASWGDKKVAAARSVKHKVRASGEEYRSVLSAFEALGLPVSKHIKFRAELKAAGRAVFKSEDGKRVTFSLVE